MTVLPQTTEPQHYTQLASTPPTQMSSKSRFRSLFKRSKIETSVTLPTTNTNEHLASCLPVIRDAPPRLPHIPRSFSDTVEVVKTTRSNRASSSHGSHKRQGDTIHTDPPPLTQAYRMAMLHASLEVPDSFTEVPTNRQDNNFSGEQSIDDFMEDAAKVKCIHRRTTSGSETCNTEHKIILLVQGPYILQYSADAGPEFLPEKILVLDKDCVAFACDAVPGRPWVLQISKISRQTPRSHERTLRPGWSRMTLRQAEHRRAVTTILVIFGDHDELYTWLYAVRKEIEHLGGLEYKPDSHHDDRTWRDNLTRKFDPPLKVANGSANASPESASSTLVQTASRCEGKNYHKSPIYQSQSSGSTNSSTRAASSLERLRDSLTSSGGSSTLATTSMTESTASTSSTVECLPNIASVADSAKGDLALRTFSRNSSLQGARSESRSTGTSILERRKLSVASLTLESDGKKGWRVLTDLPPTISGSPNDDPPPIASPPKYSSSTDAYPVSRNNTGGGLHLAASGQNKSDAKSDRSGRSSLGLMNSPFTSPSTLAKAKYSLFPVRQLVDAKEEPLASPLSLIKSTHSSKLPTNGEPPCEDGLSKPRGHRKPRSRTVTLELRQHRASALLLAGQQDIPLRSPAVTDDMIMSNFGVRDRRPPLSPTPVISVPGLADLDFDLDFLKMPHNTQTRRSVNSPESKRISSTTSVSSLHSEPTGPPPNGPLPNIPNNDPRNSRSSRQSQASTQSQAIRSNSGMKNTRRLEFDVMAARPAKTNNTTTKSETPKEFMDYTELRNKPGLTYDFDARKRITGREKNEQSKPIRQRSRSRRRQTAIKQPL